MGDLLKEKISADLATANRTAEKMRFRADFWRVFQRCLALFFFGFSLSAARHRDFEPLIGYLSVVVYSALAAWLNRRRDRLEVLHARARRVFIVRRRRESWESFEQRIAVQERYLDGQP